MTADEKTNNADLGRNLATGGKALVISRIINQFVGLGVVWSQANYLSVWAYGVFELFIGTIVIINTIGNVGVADIAKRFLPEFSEGNRDDFIAATVRILLIVRFTMSALILLFAYFFYDKVGAFFNIEEYRDVFGLFAVGALFTTETFLMTYCYSALFKQVRYVIVFTAYNIFRFVAFYFILRSGGGLAAAIAIDGASHLLLFLGLYIPFAEEYPFDRTALGELPRKRMSNYGFFMYLNNLGNILFNTTADKYVISAMLDKASLGYYSFAVRLGYAALQWMPHNLIGSAIEPFIYRGYIRENKDEALSEKFAKIITLEAFFMIPTTVFFLTFSSPVIEHIFDSKYLPASGILGGLAVVFAVSTLRFPLSIVATAKERVKLLFVAQTVFAIYNLVADILFAKYIGLWGIVLATGTASLFLVIALWIGISRFAVLRVETGSLLRISANAFLMGVFFWFARDFANSFMKVIACFLAGGSLYLILSYFNPPYNRETLKRIWRFFKESRGSKAEKTP